MRKFPVKSSDEEKIIYKNFEGRVKIKLPPKDYGGYNSKNYLIAELFSWLNSFNEGILNARKEIGIENIYSYPQNPTIEKLAGIKYKLDDDKRKLLEKETQKLIAKYKLTEDWTFTIETAILTHNLIVPEDSGIDLNVPECYYPEAKDNESLARKLVRQRIRSKNSEYPSIYFTRYASPDEIKKWVERNKGKIKAIQSHLPHKKETKRDQNTLYWGQLVWVLKEAGFSSYAEMPNLLEKMMEKFNEENMTKEEIEKIPEYNELERYYKRFLESLQKLENS